jgi:hypothetical protein
MFIASSASVTCSSRIRYKAHKLIRKWDVTNAAVHDSQKLDDVLDLSNTGKVRWSRLSEQIFRVDKWSLCRG